MNVRNAGMRMRRIRLLVLLIWMIWVLPGAAHAQWAIRRIEHDWRVRIGGNSFGLTQEFFSTFSTTIGTRTTNIYIGQFTVHTRLPAIWVAALAVTLVGTACIFAIPNLVDKNRTET